MSQILRLRLHRGRRVHPSILNELVREVVSRNRPQIIVLYFDTTAAAAIPILLLTKKGVRKRQRVTGFVATTFCPKLQKGAQFVRLIFFLKMGQSRPLFC